MGDKKRISRLWCFIRVYECHKKNKKLYTDIIVIDKSGNYIPIELKYKTKATLIDDVSLLNHGAQDLGRFDVLFDLYRIELLKYRNEEYIYSTKLINFVNGYAVLLTNDSAYYSVSKNNNNSLYKDFCLTEEDRIIKNEILSWNKKGNKSCVDNTSRDIHLKFNQSYNFKWKKYKEYNFKYLVIEV